MRFALSFGPFTILVSSLAVLTGSCNSLACLAAEVDTVVSSGANGKEEHAGRSRQEISQAERRRALGRTWPWKPAKTPSSNVIGQGKKVPIKITFMGDSYACGVGSRAFLGHFPDYIRPIGCGRAANGYGDQYAQHLGRQGYAVTFLNRACGGGSIDHFVRPRHLATFDRDCPQGNFSGPDVFYVQTSVDPPECKQYVHAQIDYVDDTVDLVMLMIGGNDISYGSLMNGCYFFWSSNAVDCRNAVEQAFRRLYTSYSSDLANLYETLRQKLTPPGEDKPRGRVVHVWYPYIARDIVYYMSNSTEGISINPAQAIRNLTDTGARVVSEIIARANEKAGVEFITLWNQSTTLFAGHEPDPRPGRNNPFKWINQYAFPIVFETFHPNWKYHLALGAGLAKSGAFGAPGGAILRSVNQTAPYAWMGESYSGKVGVPLTLDASGSFDPAGYDLVSFEWDFDSDGVFDRTTSQPMVTTTYQKPFEGLVKLRLTNSIGNTAVADAFIEISNKDFSDLCKLDPKGFPLISNSLFSACTMQDPPGFWV